MILRKFTLLCLACSWKQKASVILTLTYISPIITGELFNIVDPYYRNFLACMKITIAVFSPYADETMAGELKQLMYSYCSEFPKLYSDSVYKTKNALYASFITANTSVWTFVASKYYADLKLSMGGSRLIGGKISQTFLIHLAEKHQLYLAHNMTTTNGGPNTMFIYKGDVVKEGESVIPAELHPDVLNTIPKRFHGETLFYKTHGVEIDWFGVCFRYIIVGVRD